MQPIIVITRPNAQAQSFATDLHVAYGSELPVMIAPLMQIVPVDVENIGSPAHLIFTSVNGVDQAERLAISTTATAWCVGDQTAAAADGLGMTVKNAKGNSANLVDLILSERPQGEIVHLRGAHATGNIAERLSAAGLTCRGVVVYAQVDADPPGALLQAFGADTPLIIPVFSPRSAELLSATRPHHAPVTFVAMSEAVASALTRWCDDEVITAKFPDKISMIKATLGVYDALFPAKTT